MEKITSVIDGAKIVIFQNINVSDDGKTSEFYEVRQRTILHGRQKDGKDFGIVFLYTFAEILDLNDIEFEDLQFLKRRARYVSISFLDGNEEAKMTEIVFEDDTEMNPQIFRPLFFGIGYEIYRRMMVIYFISIGVTDVDYLYTGPMDNRYSKTVERFLKRYALALGNISEIESTVDKHRVIIYWNKDFDFSPKRSYERSEMKIICNKFQSTYEEGERNSTGVIYLNGMDAIYYCNCSRKDLFKGIKFHEEILEKMKSHGFKPSYQFVSEEMFKYIDKPYFFVYDSRKM